MEGGLKNFAWFVDVDDSAGVRLRAVVQLTD